jgi:hypothetical protein
MFVSMRSMCGSSACAEVESTEDGVVLTSTLMPGQRLDLTHEEWAVLVREVKLGTLDETVRADVYPRAMSVSERLAV